MSTRFVRIYTRNACGACEAVKREAANAVTAGAAFDLDVVNIQSEGFTHLQDFLAHQDRDSPNAEGWRAMPVVKVYDGLTSELIEAWAGNKAGKLTELVTE